MLTENYFKIIFIGKWGAFIARKKVKDIDSKART